MMMSTLFSSVQGSWPFASRVRCSTSFSKKDGNLLFFVLFFLLSFLSPLALCEDSGPGYVDHISHTFTAHSPLVDFIDPVRSKACPEATESRRPNFGFSRLLQSTSLISSDWAYNNNVRSLAAVERIGKLTNKAADNFYGHCGGRLLIIRVVHGNATLNRIRYLRNWEELDDYSANDKNAPCIESGLPQGARCRYRVETVASWTHDPEFYETEFF
ncbi:hypothetical protein CDD83_7624 [Cordyceps sp. RAO-2017]|nr:hypothetical protein CDD83_7624 [Cordyceps sp. RAO-2017]